MKTLSDYKSIYIQQRLKEAENLKPFLSRSEYERVVKRINKSNMYTVPLSALPKHLTEHD